MSLLQLEVPFDYWLFDGAIGTQLQEVDVLKAGEFGEGLNLKAPHLIGGCCGSTPAFTRALKTLTLSVTRQRFARSYIANTFSSGVSD